MEELDWIDLAIAGAALIIDQAPDIVDAIKGGDTDKAAAWLKTRENAVRERARFERLRREGEGD